MTSALKHLALNTVRHRYWRPGIHFRNFLDESVPDQVAVMLRTPYTHEEVTNVMIDGWRLKNRAMQFAPGQIDALAATFEARENARSKTGAGQEYGKRGGSEDI